jgi:hypothetical protein
MLIQDERERFHYFLDGLVELGFARVLGLNFCDQSGDIIFHGMLAKCAALSRAAVVFRMTKAGRRCPWASRVSLTRRA